MAQKSDSRGLIWWGPAVSALTMILALLRLGEPTLWLDEGVTGLLGSHILKFGLPYVEDGSLLVHEIAGDTKTGLWIWDGWLQFYISAAGQAIFGQTAFGARLFHAIAGALVPWAAYPLFRAMSSRRGVAEAATLLTGLSVPLLLSARQAHYYPEGTLLTILVIRAYLGALRSRPFAVPSLIAASVLLFHTHSVWFVTMGIALAAHVLILRPSAPVFGRLALGALAAVMVVAPFALWAEIWVRVESPLQATGSWNNRYVFLSMLRHYLLELNLYGAPVVILCLGGAAAAGLRRPISAIACLIGAVAAPIVLVGKHTAVELWAFSAVVLLFLLVGAAALVRDARKPREERGWMPGALVALLSVSLILLVSSVRLLVLMRYVVPLLPLLAFLTAAAVFSIFRREKLAWAVIALLVITNAAAVWPVRYASAHVSVTEIAIGDRNGRELSTTRLPRWTGIPVLSIATLAEFWQPLIPPKLSLRVPLYAYLAEISLPTRSPAGVIAEYINGRKRHGDRFADNLTTLFPVAFHTGLSPVRFAPGETPPRFIISGPPGWINLPTVRAWKMGQTYRKVALTSDVGPYGAWPEPDSRLDRTPDQRKNVIIWERIDLEKQNAGQKAAGS